MGETSTGRFYPKHRGDLLETTVVARRMLDGEIEPRPQPSEGVTYARRLTKADGRIDWTSPADHIARMLRAYSPWPGAHTRYQGKPLRLLRAAALPEKHWGPPPPAHRPPRSR